MNSSQIYNESRKFVGDKFPIVVKYVTPVMSRVYIKGFLYHNELIYINSNKLIKYANTRYQKISLSKC